MPSLKPLHPKGFTKLHESCEPVLTGRHAREYKRLRGVNWVGVVKEWG
jgi:hypothetical protein